MSMASRFAIAGAAVCLAVFVSACPRSLRAADAAEHAVRVTGLRAEFTPGDRGEFQLDLSVANPSPQAGALTDVQWEVWIGNRWFAAGTQQIAEPLPLNEPHQFTVTVPVVFRRTVPAVEEPVSIELGVRGGVFMRSGGLVQRLPFEARERLSVRNAPSVGGNGEP